MRITGYVVFFLIFSLCKSYAQNVPASSGGADIRDASFGFNFQFVSSDYKILKQPDWQTPYYDVEGRRVPAGGTLNSISSVSAPGFAVGFIYRRYLTDNLEVRTTPSLVFANHTIDYAYDDATLNKQKQINTSLVEVPLSLKIKSERIGNLRAYVLGGLKYSYGISSRKKGDDANTAPIDRDLLNQRGYASYEAGFGFDLYFEYFKFSPEIKVSNSINSVLQPSDNPYSKPLDKLFIHSVVFTIYFE